MNKYSRMLLTVLTGALVIGLASGPVLSAQARPAKPAIHRDGTTATKQKKVTQSDRQAAAKRAKAKGFVVPTIGTTTMAPTGTLQTEGGVKQ